ncbi:MAG: M48 family metalloprotease [Flavobacterium sp.]|nr:M48 family metalloprotease [Flavobacterium sp.]
MKVRNIATILMVFAFGICKLNAQISLGEKALGAIQNGMASLTFSNEDAARISLAAVKKMDSTHTVAPSNNGYALRLNRVFGKHTHESGLSLNYKVYLTKDVNAFATADGSVRVFSGLMDIMDDNELLAVIGHEIGHVANQDSKDAIKSAYRKAAIIGAVSSQSDKVAELTNSQLGQIGNAILESKFSRKQESDADLFSYNFLKRNKYNVNAEEGAFTVLETLSGSNQSDFLTKMLSSHPDPKDRADNAKARAQADGLYKPYVQKAFSNTVKVATKKVVKKKKK